MYTDQIDRYLGKVPSPDLIKVGEQNLKIGIQSFFGLPPESPESKLLTTAFSPRAEAISHGNLRRKPEMAIRDILEQTQSFQHDRFNGTSYQERDALLDTMCNIVQSQQIALSQTESRTIRTHGGVGISMVYADSQWEGVGSVNFFLHHESSPEEVMPAYVIRGNPYSTNTGLGFQVRNVQPWISEDMASVAGIKEGYFGIRNTLDEAHLKRVDFLLCERNRIMDILMRNNSSGRTLDGKLVHIQPEDMFLNLALTYLQKNGFNQFKGIRHEEHPAFIRKNPNHSFRFNYNQLFGKTFPDIGEDPIHPWELNCAENGGNVYLPFLNRLPPSLVSVLMSV